MKKIIPCLLIFLFLLEVIFVYGATNLEVSIPQNYKQVIGQEIGFAIKLSDFEAGRKDIILDYWISDSKGKIIYEKKETIAIETRTEFVRSIDIPKNAQPGIYALHTKITYADGKEVEGKDTFEILTEVENNSVYYVGAVILFLIAVAYLIIKTKFLLFLKKMQLKIKIREIIKKRH